MSKIKKVLAMVMTLAMVMAMGMTSFAAPGNKPIASDDLAVTVQNVEDGAVITAYQFIDAEYDENGFIGYKWVAGANAGKAVEFDAKGNVVGLTDSYVTELAKNTAGLTADASLQAGGDGKLEAGTWMLLVTGSNLNKVYNPMIVSVYYTKSGSDNTMGSDPIDANTSWSLETSGAYAKSSEVPVDKEVTDEDENAEVGKTVTFTITTTIPSYSANSVAKFDVTDTITNGLEYVLPEGSTVIAPTVKIGTEDVPADKYTVTMNGTNSFTVSFNADYVKSLAAAGTDRQITITYQAKVTSDAITEVAKNEVKVDYDQGSNTDVEYVFTYGFSGKKVDEDGNGLKDAEFTLYETWTDDGDGVKEANELSDPHGTTITGEDYKITFEGLDADKTYYLTETKAPDGYSVNSTVYEIKIANINKVNEVVTGYDIFVDGVKKATVKYGKVTDVVAFEVVNTKLSNLPGTGGIGTTIFTIGGCLIMIAAAALFFASRKKSEN